MGPLTQFVAVMLLPWFLSTGAEELKSSPPCDFPAIFNFGDSNSDTGTMSAAFYPAILPYGETFFHEPAGRASDGRLIIDFIGNNFIHGLFNSLTIFSLLCYWSDYCFCTTEANICFFRTFVTNGSMFSTLMNKLKVGPKTYLRHWPRVIYICSWPPRIPVLECLHRFNWNKLRARRKLRCRIVNHFAAKQDLLWWWFTFHSWNPNCAI